MPTARKVANSKRSFRIEEANVKFDGKKVFRTKTATGSPSAAARKAAKYLVSQLTKSKKISFVLRETTVGSKGKSWEYWAAKVKLATPKTVERKDKKTGKTVTVQITHAIKVKAAHYAAKSVKRASKW